MKERMKEFKNELRMLGDKEMTFVELSVWFQQWAVYISKGGVRPPKPH